MARTRSADEVFYAALCARDPRFDGKFFVGVKTTGIFCRPVCPAKPKRENVVFFRSRLLAERAGYRPCLRCRPESAPESPAWIGKSAIVRRALKKLDQPEIRSLDENEFAASFGVSARHLRRLFVEELGKTPRQLFAESRLDLARKLLVETSLPVTEVAFAAGFGSVRRFNDAFLARFTRSPRAVRRRLKTKEPGIRLSLSYRPPYDFGALLDFYRVHRVAALEEIDGVSYRRILHFNGKVGTVTVRNDPDRFRLLVEVSFPDSAELHVILGRVRRMFDVDCDPVVVANSLEIDPGVKRLLRRHPGVRVPSGWDGFEVAVGTILGQVVSLERGRALVEDLVRLYGPEIKSIRMFPGPEILAHADLSALKTTGARKRTIQEMSRALLEGRLSLEPTQDVDAFTEALCALPGIGPWSAAYIALKVLRHSDAFPETDLILARALDRHPKEVVDAMSPWRGYVAALFWRAYADSLSKVSRRKV